MKTEPTYEQAKKICRLTENEVQMAKRLHVSPETLIRNAASRRYEKWKDPVPLYTRRQYEKQFEKEALFYRESRMKRIGKKADEDPMIYAARRLGFTRSECFMAKDLHLTDEDLNLLNKRAKKMNLCAALLVRRMYEKLIEEGGRDHDE